MSPPDLHLGSKVTHNGDDEVGTVIDDDHRGYRVIWRSGEETVEAPEDLEPLMGRDAQPALPEGPDGV